MLMFSEFFIPYHEMPSYLRPFASISYFRYAFDAMLQAVYGFNRPVMKCHVDFCMFRDPKKYLEYLGLSLDFQKDVIVLSVWIAVLQFLLIFVLYFRVFRACR
ncbi:Abc transporter [Operophtera brumata]|uniref:Abc transporter n=1 Tax=Operophtera brumata TaxID=104452 RepID=A0A0L7KN73_OPEBR|nr:Abc transporter [Operophtera brumata]KOB66513.1 Abc transporter [Operophtera brumata]